MKLVHILALSFSASLAACGGGGGSTPANTSQRDTERLAEHSVNGAAAAVANIPSTLPPSKTFTGGFVSINGESSGYLSGSSPRNLAEQIGAFVAADPAKWSSQYRDMLSTSGLRVSVAGERSGTSAITGLALYSPASVFSVKLTTNGVVVTQLS